MRIASAVLAIFLATSLAAPAAQAHTTNTPWRLRYPTQIWVGYHDLSANFAAATDWTINNNTNPHAKLNVSSVGIGIVSDINVMDASYDLPWAGKHDCIAFNGTYCTGNQNVYYNLNLAYGNAMYGVNRSWYLNSRRWVACHEFSGHGPGIDHYDGPGCLHTTVFDADQYLKTHNNADLTAKY